MRNVHGTLYNGTSLSLLPWGIWNSKVENNNSIFGTIESTLRVKRESRTTCTSTCTSITISQYPTHIYLQYVHVKNYDLKN